MGAKGLKINDTTNLVAEAREISEGLQYCTDNQLTNIIGARTRSFCLDKAVL